MDVRSRRAQSGRDPEHDARHGGEREDERQDAPVERRRLSRRARQKLLSPASDEDSERAADGGEQQAFREELADQSRARRAQRQAHG